MQQRKTENKDEIMELVLPRDILNCFTYIAGEFMNCPIFWHVVLLVWIVLGRKKTPRIFDKMDKNVHSIELPHSCYYAVIFPEPPNYFYSPTGQGHHLLVTVKKMRGQK